MPNSYIQVAEADSGKKLAGWERTRDAQTVQDQMVVLSEPFLPTYSISVATAISAATANSHLLQIMAGSTNRFRLRRLVVTQVAVATAAAIKELALYRLTTAGTGGTSVTPRRLNPAQSNVEATAMTLATAKGTEGDQLWTGAGLVFSTAPTTGILRPLVDLAWNDARDEAPEVAAGTSNGLALKLVTGDGGTPTVRIYAEIVERIWS